MEAIDMEEFVGFFVFLIRRELSRQSREIISNALVLLAASIMKPRFTNAQRLNKTKWIIIGSIAFESMYEYCYRSCVLVGGILYHEMKLVDDDDIIKWSHN